MGEGLSSRSNLGLRGFGEAGGYFVKSAKTNKIVNRRYQKTKQLGWKSERIFVKFQRKAVNKRLSSGKFKVEGKREGR